MGYEYMHVDAVIERNLEEALDILGEMSWELVSTHRFTETVESTDRHSSYEQVLYAFTMKRPRIAGRKKR